MDELISKYTNGIVEKLKGNLEALILVGSFARNEGIAYQNNGKTDLISDIEFWAVVKNIPASRNRCCNNEKVSLGFTTRKHLTQLKPYIYTLEAKKFGKVLWGDKGILDLIPDYDFKDIEPIDGFILLNNRIVEQLILRNKIQANEAIYNYDFDKGYIQLVNSYLAFNKRYRGLYPEKKEEFLKSYQNSGTDFINKVKSAFDALSSPQNEVISRETAIIKWKELRNHFKAIWVYEADNLNKFSGLRNIKDKLKRWLQFLIYKCAIDEYFKENANCEKSRKIIQLWERFIK